MNNSAIIFDYHQRTKHHPNRYAASLGYLEWATQPDPFRSFEGARIVKLPLSFENPTMSYNAIMSDALLPSAPLSLESIAQLFQFSLGIAAWKCIGTDCWALRCNASSGNLQPTEATIILPPIEGISKKSVIAHYAVKEHALEILAEFDTDYWQEQKQHGFFVGLSSITWREMWKYGERCFRYVNMDLGHAMKAVKISARTLGLQASKVETLPIDDLETLLGLDQKERYHESEPEIGQTLLHIGGSAKSEQDLSQLLKDIPAQYQGKANLLSRSHHPWEAVDLAMKASKVDTALMPKLSVETLPLERMPNEKSVKEVILERRSAQAMDFARTHISLEQFRQMLHSVAAPVDSFRERVHFAIFVHDIETLEKGLYFYIRNAEHKEALKRLTRNDFLWEEKMPDLYLLEKGDFRSQAKFISCSQEIAGDSAFSLGMITQFREPIDSYGTHEYKELYWECGELGQQLYLEATALGLSATGIGCYLDDVMHRMLGFEDETFQTMYHFTIGRSIIDTRMSVREPYPNRS
ncbi:MAG: SagB/ThcOx family dehydrogenase [Helicobacteraceae bacterium]|jgi:SagB-type dehydrogenase family enzyme|nr:SagB/ThcOx family dehydrogenase [Helicobacteraceae bacterium]